MRIMLESDLLLIRCVVSSTDNMSQYFIVDWDIFNKRKKVSHMVPKTTPSTLLPINTINVPTLYFFRSHWNDDKPTQLKLPNPFNPPPIIKIHIIPSFNLLPTTPLTTPKRLLMRPRRPNIRIQKPRMLHNLRQSQSISRIQLKHTLQQITGLITQINLPRFELIHKRTIDNNFKSCICHGRMVIGWKTSQHDVEDDSCCP